MDLTNISIPNAALVGLVGYLVVFLGLIFLLIVVTIMVKIMSGKTKKTVQAAEAAPAVEAPEPQKAPGSAGQIKLYDTDPKDAAMIMAIVADELKTPLNELRFISIKEVKE